MNTPKQRFLESDYAKAFLDLASDQTLLTALDYAMLEMVNSEATGPDTTMAMRAGHRIDGARAFVKILLNLPVALPEKQVPIMPYNLEL